ncbi:MAG TPA: 16S rRNA (adenine(1518)-N(6)/adenine(1519)-N(6))-dimethyltransferase RsmA [Terrisporobacter glycolicus]|uniref:Ribosomal RNA small subunit methyltransferase A n=2 Tax=Terrisporobacter TaxID=1505652 RepID=A0AAX2ZK88_9FIRM|nr:MULTISPECIES: 16S rRNA (adenine(1518)-N(6)/adenine(1519)-N(6))-dimethyltransferase RsmA [Terrisporobacter]MBN9647796.1 16S rRNA (adenine(1518)-N(6)/adenine(1519)-N(6))-dimethyltransferase RsmA [Terrisporobacter glycolicus]UEL49441.1 16S rRNA (adenine(1518)-N(6)/adenine(1519)-N(6))-dimethyltransferase RsmA [Terrisporobacter hibernicus]UPA30590.1 16S rRNA (adenine(1518)-N(6)/adenine(1519)-N(6))-dimethyltransferase RsmA [Terrisporobacter glycolicus]SFJ55952.1 16S rRNA (adenine1518-N6/adenine151
MDRLSSHKATKEVVQKHNFKFSKSLGQNFLIDTNVIDRIIEGARVKEGDYVIEVGPGIGTLTKEMGKTAQKVVAIEIDKTLIPILEETLSDFPNIEVINKDILKVDVQELVKEKLNGGPVKLIANLPYYITTPIVMKFLEEDIPVTDIVVMVQKEVADRMNAKPNTKDYGALSVAVQYYCDTEIVAKAPRHMFMPQPNVDSTVIGLHVREEQIYHVDNEDVFFKTVKASFGQRRKTLLNSLGGLGFLTKDQIREALQEANIDEKRRGETLSIEEFAALSNAANRIHNENK